MSSRIRPTPDELALLRRRRARFLAQDGRGMPVAAPPQPWDFAWIARRRSRVTISRFARTMRVSHISIIMWERGRWQWQRGAAHWKKKGFTFS